MPLYEYLCRACGARSEIIQKFSDPPPGQCATCGQGPVERQQSSPAIQFKGTGWYITDYAQKGKPGSDGSTPSEGKDAASTGEKKTDTAAKTESPSKPEAATSTGSTTKSGT